MTDLKDARACETLKLLMSLLQIACCMRSLKILLLVSETNYLCHLFFATKKRILTHRYLIVRVYSFQGPPKQPSMISKILHYITPGAGRRRGNPGLLTAAIPDLIEHSSCIRSANSYLPVQHQVCTLFVDVFQETASYLGEQFGAPFQINSTYLLFITNHLGQTLLNFCTQRNNSATLGYTNNQF